VLSEYYDQVLIVERDVLPEEPVSRSGTPQAFHVHRLQPRGKIILERLFPGFTDELLEHGAFSMQNTLVKITNAYGDVEFPIPEKDAAWSRALLEWALRLRVNTFANVQFATGLEVIGLQVTPDQARVTGIYVRERGQLEQQTALSADLVIDASGRSSKLTQWLETLGCKVAEPERLKTALGYTTAYYRSSSIAAQGRGLVGVDPQPAKGLGAGAIIPVENDTTMAVLFYAGGQYPPTDAEGFKQGFSQLGGTVLAEMLQDAEMTVEPRGYRMPECVRQHYELVEQWPAGLLAVGDAFCYFDPIYGQGMTVAAIAAETLAQCLSEQRSQPRADFERFVFQRMQETVEPAWWLSAVSDLRWSGVEYVGPLPMKGFIFAQKFFDLYLKNAFQHMAQRPELFQMNIVVNGLLMSPRQIFNPQMIASLLAADPSSVEAQQLLAEFPQGDGLPSEEAIAKVLDELIPSFSHAFSDHIDLSAAHL
jgi:2-polyprenyl-6-methoxyphenol hydroxylase-like FAD-dependent oxidoreductase